MTGEMPDLTKRQVLQKGRRHAADAGGWSSRIGSACKESEMLFLECFYCMAAWMKAGGSRKRS